MSLIFLCPELITGNGGAIYTENKGKFNFSSVIFSNNVAEDFGGGLVIRHIDITNAGPEGVVAELNDCRFVANKAALTKGENAFNHS